MRKFYAIGETIQHEGQTLKVVKHHTCEGCRFNQCEECDDKPLCSSISRKDGKSVIFEEVKQ